MPVETRGSYMLQICERRLDVNMRDWKPKRQPRVKIFRNAAFLKTELMWDEEDGLVHPMYRGESTQSQVAHLR